MAWRSRTDVVAALSSSRLCAANGNRGVGCKLDAIAAVLLGGTRLFGGIGSIREMVVGALIIGVLNNGLTLLGLSSFWSFGSFWPYVATGVVVLLAVRLAAWRPPHRVAH